MIIIQASRKGMLVLAIGICSFVSVYFCWNMLARWFNIDNGPFERRVAGSLALLLAGVINYYFTRNYIANQHGEEEYYESEGTFMFIKVSLWTRIYLAIGVLTFLGTIADKYKL